MANPSAIQGRPSSRETSSHLLFSYTIGSLKIYLIQSAHRAQIDKLSEQIKKLEAEERAEAEKVLTPDQKVRLKQLSGETGKEKSAPKEKPSDKPTDK